MGFNAKQPGKIKRTDLVILAAAAVVVVLLLVWVARA